ncbi:hypothetical protein E2562_013587 [Oryza meyeriana var. granulata]|uniref:Uncharacterized protein n=1 Tax=Oryza meyeriana var. granulata TaxID=110450 RepID=A0A6G1C620_9ORYZ|nr:hypothetical protein E2562_013587 [Oryza meyeriana var. granulata]
MEAGTVLYGGDVVRSPQRTETRPPPGDEGFSALRRQRHSEPVKGGGRFTPSGDEGFGALRGQRRPEPVRDTVGSTPSASWHSTEAAALYGANIAWSPRRTWWGTTPPGI